jgi:hypothetical protein
MPISPQLPDASAPQSSNAVSPTLVGNAHDPRRLAYLSEQLIDRNPASVPWAG